MNRGEETPKSMSLLFAMTYFPHLSSVFAILVFLRINKKRIEKQYLPQRTKIPILFCVQILLLLNPVQPVTCLCFGNNIQKAQSFIGLMQYPGPSL